MSRPACPPPPELSECLGIVCCGPNPFSYEVCKKQFFSAQVCATASCDDSPITDNGFDPILGPPYPPVDYQAFLDRPAGGPTKLTWSIPDVIIAVDAVSGGPHVLYIVLRNYPALPLPAGTIARCFKFEPSTSSWRHTATSEPTDGQFGDLGESYLVDVGPAPLHPAFVFLGVLPLAGYYYVTVEAGGVTLTSQIVTIA